MDRSCQCDTCQVYKDTLKQELDIIDAKLASLKTELLEHRWVETDKKNHYVLHQLEYSPVVRRLLEYTNYKGLDD